ncbi:Uncharacterised protein [Salmonella enterica subsp. enterica]|uniref:Uncharacterized protein n=1 Tax=Salmonella enterica I TaxID=59201 RepID=A0A447MV73_SALET|nr:Uncharacterised protein [Salmonella enterica subsp. enterica]
MMVVLALVILAALGGEGRRQTCIDSATGDGA